LQISPCESIFYPYPTPVSATQLNENKDFRGFAEKNIETQEGAKKRQTIRPAQTCWLKK
jgi:hypothetical protein